MIGLIKMDGGEGYFFSQEGKMRIRDADRIREFVYEHFIKLAKRNGLSSVSFRAKDIHQGMLFEKHNYPNIIAALCHEIMKTRYGVKQIRKEPPSDASDIIIIYELRSASC